MSKTNKLMILLPVLLLSFFLGVTNMFGFSDTPRLIFSVIFFIALFIFLYMSFQKVPYNECSTCAPIEYQDPDKLEKN